MLKSKFHELRQTLLGAGAAGVYRYQGRMSPSADWVDLSYEDWLVELGAVMADKPAGRKDAETTPQTPEERTAPAARDTQVAGNHYKNMDVQPWDVVDTWPLEQRIGFYRGNALKYLMRMGAKDENAQEIAKGKHYLEKLLEVLG